MVSRSSIGDEEAPLLFSVDKGTKDHVAKDEDISTQVYAMYVVAILMVVILSAAHPPMLLYLESLGYASTSDVSFYFVCTVIGTITPVVGNIVFGLMSTAIGTARVLTINCIMICIGLVGMTIAQSKQTFAIMLTLQATLLCSSTLRITLLTKIVPLHKRTQALMYHNISACGGIIGPLIWLLCSRFNGQVNFGFTILNKYTLDFLVCSCVAILMALISFRFLVMNEHLVQPDALRPMTTGMSSNLRPSRQQLFLLGYFSAVLLCVQFVSAIYTETVQPILVNHFGIDDQDIAIVYEVVVLVALLPTLGVALLSRVLKDSYILCAGLCLQLVAAALYLPLWGSVHMFQVVIGFAFMVTSSIFIVSSTMSLFSKLLQSIHTGAFLGMLASIAGIGYAFPQFLLGETAVKLFNTLNFAIFAAPTTLALILVLWPKYWTMLNLT